MILSNKDIVELANDRNQPRLVRYLAKRIVNMHKRIAFDNERIDALAGALTHISVTAKTRLDDETKKWKERLLNRVDEEIDEGIDEG